jgi:hypothetical protein
MNKKWVILLLSLLISIFIIFAVFAIFMLIPAPSQEDESAASVKVIEAPTSTPFLLPTFEPTLVPGSQPGSGQNNGIFVGGYAQITGTSGDGLSIRSAAGRSNSIQFIGLDSELFKVVDGPVDNEGFIWWKVEAPYDSSRTGWCVQDYLSVVVSPQE